MMILLKVYFLFIFVSFSTIYANEVWSRKADFGGTAVSDAVAFTIGNKGYVGTGFAYEGSYTNIYSVDLWEYDPSEDVWTQKADFGGTGRASAIGFSIGDKGYIGTGYYYDEGWQLLSDFWEYNPQLNIWTQRADFAGTARFNAFGLSIENKGYIGTGNVDWDFGPWFKDFWEYDPDTDSWEQKADFPGESRHGAAGFTINNKGYLGTGYGDGENYKDFWEYDPDSDQWIRKADFGGAARSEAVGFTIDGKGYIGTGRGMNLHRDFWEYDPQTDTWNRKPDFNGVERWNAVGFAIGNRGYVGTGGLIDFWEFDPDKEIFSRPELIAPENASLDISNENIHMKWHSISGAEYYHLQISSDRGFYPLSINEESVSDTVFIVNVLSPETRYYWRVKAKSESGESDWSDIFEFTTGNNPWMRVADYGGSSRQFAVGFAIGEKGYVGTGLSSEGYHNDFWEYDPDNNTWTQKADFGGEARMMAVGFSLEGKGYVGTGRGGNNRFNDFWEYDPALNVWTQRADFAGSARESAVGFSINDKGYLGTGYAGGATSSRDFWQYNPADDTWSRIADFPEGKQRSVGFSIADKGYVGTGGFGKDFWEYDPATDIWTRKADFGGEGRQFASGFSMDGKGYIGTGELQFGTARDFWMYDPETDIWTKLTDYAGSGRVGAVSFSIDSTGYVGTGGWANTRYKDFWEYDPDRDDTVQPEPWVRRADFGGDRRGGAVSFAIGNKGYIGTGFSTGPQKDFWEYDPVNGIWKQVADFVGIERRNAVGFSINDRGYVGMGSNLEGLKDFWEYNPEINTWQRKADFPGIAVNNIQSFSIGNKGYIGVGEYGVDGNAHYTREFWEYDPQNDTWTQKADFGGDDRYGGVSFSIGDKGYMGGAIHSNRLDFWEYNPQADQWTERARIPDVCTGTFSYGMVGFSIGNKGYAGINRELSHEGKFCMYDPIEDKWSERPSFPGPVRFADHVAFSIGEKGYVRAMAAPVNGGLQFWEFNPGIYTNVYENNINENNVISGFHLYQNYPNPFNPTTVIGYTVPERGHVSLTVYNTIGQKVATLVNEEQPAQFYEITFNASGLPSGVYIYRLQIGSFRESKRMIYIR